MIKSWKPYIIYLLFSHLWWAVFHFSLWAPNAPISLEIPLYTNGGIDEEGLVVDGVINEIIADLYLGTYAEMVGEVIPQLGLGEDHELPMTVGLLTAPEIDEA